MEERRATVEVETGETVTCVFTNRKRVGTLVIEKQVVPDGDPARFDFQAQGIAFFALGDGERSTTDVAPGAYEVTESAANGFDLSSLTCDDGASAQPSTTSLGDRRATVKLELGETVTCVFTDRKRGRVVVRKEVSPGSPSRARSASPARRRWACSSCPRAPSAPRASSPATTRSLRTRRRRGCC